MPKTQKNRLVAVAFLLLFLASSTGAQEAQEVTVTLKDFDLGFQEMTVPSGTVRFTVTNQGTREHSFVLEWTVGGNTYRAGTKVLTPGESSVLFVTLPVGRYEAYCYVSGHRELGMEGKVVARKGAAVEKKAPIQPQPTRPAYY